MKDAFSPAAIGLALALALTSPTSRVRLAHADPGPAPAPRVQVRGSARLDVRAARAAGRLVLSGAVTDDIGRPLGGARVALTLTHAKGDGALVSLATGGDGASPAACSDGASPPVLERADTLVLPSDDGGRFCVRLALPVDRYVVKLESRAAGLVDAAHVELAVDTSLPPLTLRFDPEPAAVSLDDDSASFDVVASTEDDGVTRPAGGLTLTLASEIDTLATARTNAAGRVHVTVPSARLGPPGRGELRASFDGSPEAGASQVTAHIERRARVELSAPEAREGKLAPAPLDEGVPLEITARPATATGAVEARLVDAHGESVVGAANLDRGAATLVVTIPPAAQGPEDRGATLRVRFVPDAPWFRAGPELTLLQPARPPSPWRKVPLLLATLLALGWLVVSRWSSRAPAAAALARRSTAPPPEPRVALVEAGPADQGWRGRLVDAHDGAPVAAARVAVERRAFDRLATVVQTWTGDDGRFALPQAMVAPGDELVAEGRAHAEVRRPLPPPGILEVALVLRRRAVLDRLVAWARGRGAPFDAKPEPTPGHVRRAAGSEFTVARWADAVERAAYGGGVVDASAEADVERMAPAPPAAPGDRAGEPGGRGPR